MNFIMKKGLIHQEYITAVSHFVFAKNMATIYKRIISTTIMRNVEVADVFVQLRTYVRRLCVG